MTETHAKYLNLRLFLEGVEVPVVGVTLRVGMNAAAAADIEIVPTDRVLNLLPRTMVHLFYYDSYGASGLQESDENYKLLFMGEVISVAFVRTEATRGAILQCLDHSLYWDTCYQMMVDYGPQGNFFMGSAQAFLGTNSNLFDTLGLGRDITTVLSEVIARRPVTPGLDRLPNGLLAGLVHLLEAVGGVPNEFSGANDFFTIGELRSRLLHQIGAAKEDKTPERLMKYQAFLKFIRNQMAGGGGVYSFRDITKILLQSIVHDVVPNPVAPYIPATSQKVSSVKTALKDKRAGPVFYNIQRSSSLISKMIGILVDARDSKNVEVRGEKRLTQFRFTKDVFDESKFSEAGTHVTILEGRQAVSRVVREMKDPEGRLRIALSQAQSSPTSTGLKSIEMDLEAAIAQLNPNNVIPNVDTIGISTKDGVFTSQFSFNVDQSSEQARKMMSDVMNSLLTNLRDAKKNLDIATRKITSSRKQMWSVVDSRVPTQLFFPDIWFAPPPKCNIIFPARSFQYNFQRGMLREITRLQMSTSMMIGGEVISDKLLKSYYYAPAIEEFALKTRNCRWFMSSPTIMDHEKHTGIIPQMESISEIGRFIQRARKGLKLSAKINYVQRIAHYSFFRNRYAARTVSFNGPVVYNLVAGLPAVLMIGGTPTPRILKGDEDTLVTPAEAIEAIVTKGVALTNSPRHLIGKLVAFNLVVNQSGGTTSGTMQYVRVHGGDDDDLIKKFEKISRRRRPYSLSIWKAKRENDVQMAALVAALTPQRKRKADGTIDYSVPPQAPAIEVGDIDPRTGREILAIEYLWVRAAIVKNEEVQEDEKDGGIKVALPSGSPGIPDAPRNMVSVEKVLRTPGARNMTFSANPVITTALDPSVLKALGKSISGLSVNDILESFDAALQVRIYVAEETDFAVDLAPFEYLIMPRWMDEGTYHPKYITEKFYRDLIDSAAITDKESLGAMRSSTGLKTEDVTSLDDDDTPLTVSQALDVLSILYGVARNSGVAGVLDEFATGFNFRSVASMPDILGSRGLEYRVEGDEVKVYVNGKELNAPIRGEVIGASPGAEDGNSAIEALHQEGFHSRSVSRSLSEIGNLAGLLPRSLVADDYSGRYLKKSKRVRVPGSLDPRPEKLRKVLDYKDQLQSSQDGPTTFGVSSEGELAKGLIG